MESHLFIFIMTNSTLTVFTGNICSFDFNYKRRIYFLSTGKTMENVRLRNANYKLVRNVKKAVKMASKPTFESFKIINDDLALIILNDSNVGFDAIFTAFLTLRTSL